MRWMETLLMKLFLSIDAPAKMWENKPKRVS